MRLLADGSTGLGLALRSASAVVSIRTQRTTDNGLNIALAEQHSFPLADVFQFLHSETMPPILEQAALDSPIFQTRWRGMRRGLCFAAFSGGKKVRRRFSACAPTIS